ncbi:MAG: PhzF family phenazine biosynthesis protein [candidate division Zixibacteria bacterium]|nr:PhzF family phenazine biosynthesis protein [candidate division Zixibacteria bacterium]MDD5426029.1 PhzF family phenazine biosynthesis protein [candidate division Zixibacteria bacterium]
MKDLIFYILDVFADSKYAGNQLAVVRSGDKLTDKQMQCIANEMHFSETSFILSEEEKNGGYPVRIFTLVSELPFAGHPTLGTAFAIQQEIIKKKVEKIVLNLKVGPIPVTFIYHNNFPELLWMQQNPPSFGCQFQAEKVARALNLKVGDFDAEFPVMEVSTGSPTLIAPLKTLEAVKRARSNQEFFYDLVKNVEAKTILFFAPETYDRENQLHVRFFADCLGVPEDPATGSANGCLAAYLVKCRYFGKDNIDIRVEQGHEIDRPSRLYLKADESYSKFNINVGGKVFMIARGRFE